MFFLKKRQKITPKFKDQLASQKSPKNGVRGAISGQKLSRIHAREAKNPWELPELLKFPDDPQSEIRQERSSKRKAPESAPQREDYFRTSEAPSCNYPMDNNDMDTECH